MGSMLHIMIPYLGMHVLVLATSLTGGRLQDCYGARSGTRDDGGPAAGTMAGTTATGMAGATEAPPDPLEIKPTPRLELRCTWNQGRVVGRIGTVFAYECSSAPPVRKK